MFSNYFLKLSAFIAGVVMLASSWLASAQEPTNPSSSKICGDTVSINGDADPLYRSLSKATGQSPRWNFHKYLIDREGKLAGSYGSAVEPRLQTRNLFQPGRYNSAAGKGDGRDRLAQLW